MKKFIFLLTLAVLLPAALTGCNKAEYAESGGVIITADELADYIGAPGVVIVDMQSAASYEEGHVTGAVNIPLSRIVVSVPFENTLAAANRIQIVMGEAGIGGDTKVVIYDDGNSMHASRLWWTLLVYGHENAVVVSGGLPLIQKSGITLTTDVVEPAEVEFPVTDNRELYLATIEDVLAQVNEPNKNTVLLDARRNDEFAAGGKVPSSIMFDYIRNFYIDGMFMDIRATRINYLEAGVRPENEIITYCRTSMRSACTFIALWNAGYRNIKMYDGAFMEYSANTSNPLEFPAGGAVSGSGRDGS